MSTFTRHDPEFCSRTGHVPGSQRLPGIRKLLFWFVGVGALAWIIFRVATKPSRVSYPCVRAAMPFASSLVGYMVFFGASLVAWFKVKKTKSISAALCAVICGILGLIGPSAITSHSTSSQLPSTVVDSLNPLGNAIGIFPGRVVWVHRPDATNENCLPGSVGHEWYRVENTNQEVVDAMVSAAIRGLTGVTSDYASWDTIFHFHNTRNGRGNIGYSSGEKVFIKINATSSWNGNFNPVDLSALPGVAYYAVSETSPAIVLSILRQLVNVVGIAQTDIYVGDPMKHIYRHSYELWHAEFPNAHYLDASGYEHLGRERVVRSATARISYSDRGTVLRTGGTTGAPVYEDTLYTVFDQATYLLNIPMLKGHRRAGMTMFAKNHFGSNARSGATHLHGGLVAPNEESPPGRSGYGLYRVQVDLLGHELLGKKNLFYLMDALWATDYELNQPLKWMMAPFNNDWMSSVFASLDPIAIESVGYDFLRTEFTPARGAGTYVQMYGTDDYLHQAADSTRWAAGIRYDPENDGTVLGSLGVHEHWDDGTHKQYTRNLGIGNGIELLKWVDGLAVGHSAGWNLISNPIRRVPGTDSVSLLYPSSTNDYVFAFVPDSGYRLSFVMPNGPGYWAKFPSGAIDTITGTLRTRDTISVLAGWNIVGSISHPVDTSAIISIPAGIKGSDWFGYSGGYSAVTQLMPGLGYWVKANGAGRFVVANPPLTRP
jgi:hypothetical protein